METPLVEPIYPPKALYNQQRLFRCRNGQCTRLYRSRLSRMAFCTFLLQTVRRRGKYPKVRNGAIITVLDSRDSDTSISHAPDDVSKATTDRVYQPKASPRLLAKKSTPQTSTSGSRRIPTRSKTTMPSAGIRCTPSTWSTLRKQASPID